MTVVKVKVLNFSVVDITGMKGGQINMPDEKDIKDFMLQLKDFFSELQEKKIVEIKELNIAFIDASNGENIKIL